MMTSSSGPWNHNQALPLLARPPTATDVLTRPTIPHQRYGTADSGSPDSPDPWTAAFNEALGQLGDEKRAIVQRYQNPKELFENLAKTNDKHKHKSILRRGVERIHIPLKFFEKALDITTPLASLEPCSSVTLGLIRSVTTLAVGICGVEERLQEQITLMLEQLDVIDRYDALGQKLDAGAPVHKALVSVYKDLLEFYFAVIRVLAQKSTVLAWISEQFNEKIPPIVKDFLRHAGQLQNYISTATAEIVKSVEQLLLDSKIEQLLGARILEQSVEFHNALGEKTAQDACQWVVGDPTFREWDNESPAQPLVLFGDMGCGKTATMYFMVERLNQLSKEAVPSPIICYHYCRDDETGKALYVYANLIRQLTYDKPQVKIDFHRWCEERHSEGHKAPARDSALLGDFFFDSVRSLKRPVFVLIDGLDECKDRSRIELANNLMKHSSSIPNLKACVSSRLQEDIRHLLKGSSEIIMRPAPQRDAMIVSYMVNKRLSSLDDKARDFVIQRLTELAKGSAIWVQIAVDLLATRKIHAPAKLRAFLRDELPNSKLSDLYAKLFSQVIEGDEENAKFLSDTLEILAVAERPLSILELSWAVALKDTDTDATTVQDLPDYVDSKRVLALVNPFIASVDSNDEKRHQVRVVHQSVRELVIHSPPSQWSNLRTLAQVSNEAVQQRRSEIHGKFARDCARYLLLDDLKEKTLFSENQAWEQVIEGVLGGFDLSDDEEEESPPDSTTDNSFDPSDRGFGELFVYASCYWLHHLRRAGHGVALSDFISLTTERTRRFQNWWEQFLRPDCILQPREVTWRPNPLSIAAVYGTEALLKGLLDDVDAGPDDSRRPAGPRVFSLEETCAQAVSAVLAQGELDRLPLLIRYGDGKDITHAMNGFFLVIQEWAHRRAHGMMTADTSKCFEKIFNHIEGAYDILVDQEWGNELLCSAAGSGCLPVIERLFGAAEHRPALRRELLRVPHRDGGRHVSRHQSVGEAVWNGHGDVVSFLLEQDGIEAHLKYEDAMGNTVFHKATRHENSSALATLELLISRFPDGVNKKNNSGDTPLHVFAFSGRTELASLLLSVGRADVRCGSIEEPSGWYDPIRAATRAGNVAMCEILVRVGGVDPLSVFQAGEGNSLPFIDPVNEDIAGRVRAALLSLKTEKEVE